ncbi:DUF4176 domain-containing protein [Xylocopilactobacillus apicola]|uniref:DUF4176 domain-containing protein n=1 Tax=Xylocopilactobacillus apicola TaxID=2932184 RepID=A0AAU9DLG9_9LACO|nr:DUF4176 domain-containing protein [Xylocopilactobacillus apicola]BDR59416.1 hypothetical protein XA3_18570 [Xylocopilactobacillus apicola]
MLAIGSVVYLVNGNQKVMILNWGPIIDQGGEKVYFDYTGALYPSGLDPEQVYYFNDEDVDEVVYEGYKDDDGQRLEIMYEKWVEENAGKIKKGVPDAL